MEDVKTNPATKLLENPFGDLQAEGWAADKAVERFVPPPMPARVWDEIRIPRNQILWGGWGTGKSVLLKRISWPAMCRESSFDGEHFIGIYLNLGGLDPLNTALAFLCGHEVSDAEIAAWAESHSDSFQCFENGARYLITLHLSIAACQTVLDTPCSEKNFKHLAKRIRGIFPNLVLGENIIGSLREERDRVTLLIGRRDILEASKQLGQAPEVRNAAMVLASAIQEELGEMRAKVGFLLDQFDQLAPALQGLFMLMLRRENPFFTIVATRPFGIAAEVIRAHNVRPGNDFWLTFVEYSVTEEDAFQRFVEAATTRLLKCHGIEIDGNVSALFEPHMKRSASENLPVGMAGLSKLAFPSVRRFFEICYNCWIRASPEWKAPLMFTPQNQADAVKAVAEGEKDRVRDVQRLTHQELWGLVSLVGRQLSNGRRDLRKNCGVSSPIWLTCDDASAIEKEKDVHELLREAFRQGAIRSIDRPTSALHIPQAFVMGRIFAPILPVSLEGTDGISLSTEELKRLTRRPQRSRQRRLVLPKPTGPLRSVFLSTSFCKADEFKRSRDAIREAFAERNITVVEGCAEGVNQIEQIFQQMHSTQLTLLETTQERPNVILEMGLSLADFHRIVPLVNTQASATLPRTKPDLPGGSFLYELGSISYSFDPGGLKKMVTRVIEKWQTIEEQAFRWQVLAESSKGQYTLRRKTPPTRTCYLHYPADVAEIFEWRIPQLKDRMKGIGYDLLLRTDVARSCFTELETVAHLVSRASHIVVETSSQHPEVPDLLSCFVLGFAYAVRQPAAKRVLRVERGESKSGARTLSMWPYTETETWFSLDELADVVQTFLSKGRPKYAGEEKGLFE